MSDSKIVVRNRGKVKRDHDIVNLVINQRRIFGDQILSKRGGDSDSFNLKDLQ